MSEQNKQFPKKSSTVTSSKNCPSRRRLCHYRDQKPDIRCSPASPVTSSPVHINEELAEATMFRWPHRPRHAVSQFHLHRARHQAASPRRDLPGPDPQVQGPGEDRRRRRDPLHPSKELVPESRKVKFDTICRVAASPWSKAKLRHHGADPLRHQSAAGRLSAPPDGFCKRNARLPAGRYLWRGQGC